MRLCFFSAQNGLDGICFCQEMCDAYQAFIEEKEENQTCTIPDYEITSTLSDEALARIEQQRAEAFQEYLANCNTDHSECCTEDDQSGLTCSECCCDISSAEDGELRWLGDDFTRADFAFSITPVR